MILENFTSSIASMEKAYKFFDDENKPLDKMDKEQTHTHNLKMMFN